MAIQSENVTYSVGGTSMQSCLAWDDAQDGTRPGVLVFPEWWGLNDYIQERTKQLASIGYVALGVDMYGEGTTVDTPEQAGALMSGVLADMEMGTARVQAALDALSSVGPLGYRRRVFHLWKFLKIPHVSTAKF